MPQKLLKGGNYSRKYGSFRIMVIFYFINWIVAAETIKGGKLFKGGNYSRKYGMWTSFLFNRGLAWQYSIPAYLNYFHVPNKFIHVNEYVNSNHVINITLFLNSINKHCNDKNRGQSGQLRDIAKVLRIKYVKSRYFKNRS